jgi:hypothetical protein
LPACSINRRPHREPETAAVAERPIDREPIEADGYSKTGPGPMAAIRFKWSVRRGDNGEYYVDETIGEKLGAGCQRTADEGCRDRSG